MKDSWYFIEPYRGKLFTHEWPAIHELIDINAARFPDKKAFLVFDPKEMVLTYGEIQNKCKKLAYYLISQGLKEGDRVALTGKNSPQWACAYLAVLYAGGVIVPIDYQLGIERISHLVKFAGSKFLFSDEEKEKDLSLTVDNIPLLSLAPGKPNYLFELEADAVKLPQVDIDKVAAILYTSGTTGNEKGVMLSHRNFVTDVFVAASHNIMRIYDKDVFYALLPIHHSYTMTAVFLEALGHGSSVVFGKKMAIKQILKDLDKGKVTMFLGIPLLFNKILAGILKGLREKGIIVYGIIRGLMSFSGFCKKYLKINIGKKMFGFILKKVNLHTNRICISGGGPLAPETFKLFNQLGIDFVQGYGMTETAPIITLNPVKSFKESSVGVILPRLDVRIADADSNGIGEIQVKGPINCLGYFQDEESTKALFTEQGFLKTGDMGYIDKDNYLYITGRMKSLIVTEGGKNVYPEEIEDEFQLFGEIEQILVKGYIKDEKLKSEGIEAWIYPAEEASSQMSEKELEQLFQSQVDQVNTRLVTYKKINRFKILKEPMEMTTTKKIKRLKVINQLEGTL
ncbi:AMP-binding protein [Spirochaeta cellobiosiphila]|uniref:AMP-binding protein n=1 Tax=Spirochaeta cellobiosiphila TaxID=504483 RepID=UPI0003FB92C5|nr:AMP-binding protein [Spirochaeta cellobiosiphila]